MSAFPSPAHRERLVSLLKVSGVRRIEVSFAGSGDSGSIEGADAVCHDNTEFDLTNVRIKWPEQSMQVLDKGQWVYKRSGKEIDKSLEEILKQVCEDALEEQGLDWYNNDGGQGELVMEFIDVEPSIILYTRINVTTTEDTELEL